MKLAAAALTDTGKVRAKNEDALESVEPKDAADQRAKGWLFVVADGMGGHRGGDIASDLAVKTLKTSYYADGSKDRAVALKGAVENANRVVLAESVSDTSLAGMGTTCTAMTVHKGSAFFAHVGDSRAYVLRKGGLVQITEDHSLVGEMVRSGILSDEDARNHPQRNVITRSLGIHEKVVVDTPFSPFILEKGDVFVLCSDGLTSMVSDREIRDALGENKPDQACRELVDMANQRGGKDNITVLIVEILKL